MARVRGRLKCADKTKAGVNLDRATSFYGRERELQRLKELSQKKTASLVVIKGRRRIGKSRLASELAKSLSKYTAMHFQGLPPSEKLNAQQEREDFAQQISRQAGIPAPRADDWNTLLWTLADRSKNGRYLIVLDEINWLGSKDSTFLGKLKNAWDLQFSKSPHLILILSGSLSSWIERNILHNTGFLGRVSLDLTLSELPLTACNLFWGKHRQRVSAYEKFRLLAVTGGVPRYLEEMNPALSADANLQRMCFSPEGLLFNEFTHLFSDLFSSRNGTYRAIVSALVNGALDLNELYKALGIGKTGKISDYTDDLVEAGLLSRDYTWDLSDGREGKLSRLRLSDNYLRFYLKYIGPNRRRIERGTLSRLPNIDSIMGLQFENTVLRNRPLIFRRLGIDPNDVVYDNPFFQRKTQRHKGCQVDYLIQTRQNVLYVCEMKFSKNAVPRGVITEVQEKISRIQMPKRMSFRPVLIHVGELAEQIEHAEYFAATINFAEFLESSAAP